MGEICCSIFYSVIDGTVEGTNVSFPDNVLYNDHSFYGNGCPNTWGEGGSTVACSTRIVQTEDGEDQINGVSYNYQAITAGTGVALTTENANAPDSFCPLGWQLPYGGTGGDYYNAPKSWEDFRRKNQVTADPAGLHRIRIYPLSFALSGNYHWIEGKLFMQGIQHYHYSSTVKSLYNAYRLVGQLSPSEDTKGGGASLRCTQLHRRHGGRNRTGWI